MRGAGRGCTYVYYVHVVYRVYEYECPHRLIESIDSRSCRSYCVDTRIHEKSTMSLHSGDSGSSTPPPLPVRNTSVSSFGSATTTPTESNFHGRHGSTTSSNGLGRYASISNQTGARKMTNTVRASNKAAILAVGEELRQLLHAESPPLIKDRRYHLRTYHTCFAGHEMVDWLLKKGEVESRNEAVAMMQKLIDNGVIHHGTCVLCGAVLVLRDGE